MEFLFLALRMTIKRQNILCLDSLGYAFFIYKEYLIVFQRDSLKWNSLYFKESILKVIITKNSHPIRPRAVGLELTEFFGRVMVHKCNKHIFLNELTVVKLQKYHNCNGFSFNCMVNVDKVEGKTVIQSINSS